MSIVLNNLTLWTTKDTQFKKNNRMDIKNAKAQMRKGVLEMCVLAVIAERETYPPEIVERLRGTNLFIVEGTLYPLLIRLKNDGLVDYIWREGSQGPPRKYFNITDTGRQFLQELTDSWQELVESVAQTLYGAADEKPASKKSSAKKTPPALNIEPMPPSGE